MGLDLKKLKLHIVLMTFIAVLVVFLGAQRVFYSQRVLSPLSEAVSGIEGVEEVVLTQSRGGIQVELVVASDGDLQSVISKVRQEAEMADKRVKVQIRDNGNELLEDVFQEMLFPIEEAIAQGNFLTMAQLVGEIANDHGVLHQVGVDRDYVYLTVRQGSGIMHRVITRGDAPAVQVVGGGTS